MHFIDVGTCIGHRGGNSGERARYVARTNFDAGQPASAHHATLNNGGQQHGVNVAAAQHQADFFTGKAGRVFKQRRQACRARAFNQGFLNLQQHHHGLLNIAFIHQH